MTFAEEIKAKRAKLMEYLEAALSLSDDTKDGVGFSPCKPSVVTLTVSFSFTF